MCDAHRQDAGFNALHFSIILHAYLLYALHYGIMAGRAGRHKVEGTERTSCSSVCKHCNTLH